MLWRARARDHKASNATRYHVHVIPAAGNAVYRFEFSTTHLATAALFVMLGVGGVSTYYSIHLHHADARVAQLRSVTHDHAKRLALFDRQAAKIDEELRRLREQNRQIQKLIGEGVAPPFSSGMPLASPVVGQTAGAAANRVLSGSTAYMTAALRLRQLRLDSERARRDGAKLHETALRVLNMQHLAALSRSRLLAAIPSINPVGNAAIASPFGLRVFPWPEFHRGVDLEANYGDTVRAAAAGQVASANWDGGFGMKIDINHGNGYHTWYAHLSRANVKPGDYVTKAQPIAQVGSTGASTGPHLHYQVMYAGSAIDPEPFLTGVPEKVLASLK